VNAHDKDDVAHHRNHAKQIVGAALLIASRPMTLRGLQGSLPQRALDSIWAERWCPMIASGLVRSAVLRVLARCSRELFMTMAHAGICLLPALFTWPGGLWTAPGWRFRRFCRLAGLRMAAGWCRLSS